MKNVSLLRKVSYIFKHTGFPLIGGYFCPHQWSHEALSYISRHQFVERTVTL